MEESHNCEDVHDNIGSHNDVYHNNDKKRTFSPTSLGKISELLNEKESSKTPTCINHENEQGNYANDYGKRILIDSKRNETGKTNRATRSASVDVHLLKSPMNSPPKHRTRSAVYRRSPRASDSRDHSKLLTTLKNQTRQIERLKKMVGSLAVEKEAEKDVRMSILKIHTIEHDNSLANEMQGMKKALQRLTSERERMKKENVDFEHQNLIKENAKLKANLHPKSKETTETQINQTLSREASSDVEKKLRSMLRVEEGKLLMVQDRQRVQLDALSKKIALLESMLEKKESIIRDLKMENQRYKEILEKIREEMKVKASNLAKQSESNATLIATIKNLENHIHTLEAVSPENEQCTGKCNDETKASTFTTLQKEKSSQSTAIVGRVGRIVSGIASRVLDTLSSRDDFMIVVFRLGSVAGICWFSTLVLGLKNRAQNQKESDYIIIS